MLCLRAGPCSREWGKGSTVEPAVLGGFAGCELPVWFGVGHLEAIKVRH